MGIELRLLRYFAVVAEELHVGVRTAAAWRTANRSPLLKQLVGLLPAAHEAPLQVDPTRTPASR
jgi:hypothetical protein